MKRFTGLIVLMLAVAALLAFSVFAEPADSAGNQDQSAGIEINLVIEPDGTVREVSTAEFWRFVAEQRQWSTPVDNINYTNALDRLGERNSNDTSYAEHVETYRLAKSSARGKTTAATQRTRAVRDVTG